MAAIAEETLKALVDAIRERLKPLAVYLFGSQALGQAGPESDLDIAVLGFSPYSPWLLFTLAQELVSCFPIPELDLLDLATAPPSLQFARFGHCSPFASGPGGDRGSALVLCRSSALCPVRDSRIEGVRLPEGAAKAS